MMMDYSDIIVSSPLVAGFGALSSSPPDVFLDDNPLQVVSHDHLAVHHPHDDDCDSLGSGSGYDSPGSISSANSWNQLSESSGSNPGNVSPYSPLPNAFDFDGDFVPGPFGKPASRGVNVSPFQHHQQQHLQQFTSNLPQTPQFSTMPQQHVMPVPISSSKTNPLVQVEAVAATSASTQPTTPSLLSFPSASSSGKQDAQDSTSSSDSSAMYPPTSSTTTTTSSKSSSTSTSKTTTRKRKRATSRKGKNSAANHVDDGLTPAEREAALKKRRLARKAELARMSRRKKKMRLVELEGQVAQLQAQLKAEREAFAIERQQLASAAAASNNHNRNPNNTSSLNNTHDNINQDHNNNTTTSAGSVQPPSGSPEAMNQAVQGLIPAFGQKASEAESKDAIDKLLESMRDRNVVTGTSLDACRRHLSHSLPMEFLQWILSQNDDSFYTNPTGVFVSVFQNELGVTPEQMQEIKTLRSHMPLQRDYLLRSVAAFQQLNQAMGGYLSTSVSNMERITSILTPSQVSKLFGWTQRFGQLCFKLGNTTAPTYR